MMDINKWTAEKCRVKYYCTGGSLYYGNDDAVDAMSKGDIVLLDRADVCRGMIQWTMDDARCRNVFWEHYFDDRPNRALTLDRALSGDSRVNVFDFMGEVVGLGEGKSIAEAEIKCIEAIMKADV
jgi:hypothetical protein